MSDMQSVAGSPVADTPATLLFVDDEGNILSSLKRLFRPLGYRIFTAEGGAQGLEIMAREAVDLVISDMRMPEMNGAQFLEKVRAGWPDTIRILLTGYAEIGATIDAINKGQIYRYISKPWEDNDITLAVKQALALKLLEREKLRLEALTLSQNEALKDLNATLEDRVKARTEEVRQTMGFLEVANDKLKKSFITSIRVFANLIEMREGKMAGHSRRVADQARVLAQRMGMKEAEVQDVFLAALLHDVGKGIDPMDHVNAGLAVLDGHISERTKWFIENHGLAQRVKDGTAGARARRRLTNAEDGDALDLLANCDREGRLPGRIVCTPEDAIEYIRQLEEENEQEGDEEVVDVTE